MPPAAPLSLDARDVFFLSPVLVLTFWGLLVLLTDLVLARRLAPEDRRRAIGWLARAGAVAATPASPCHPGCPTGNRGWRSR